MVAAATPATTGPLTRMPTAKAAQPHITSRVETGVPSRAGAIEPQQHALHAHHGGQQHRVGGGDGGFGGQQHRESQQQRRQQAHLGAEQPSRTRR